MLSRLKNCSIFVAVEYHRNGFAMRKIEVLGFVNSLFFYRAVCLTVA